MAGLRRIDMNFVSWWGISIEEPVIRVIMSSCFAGWPVANMTFGAPAESILRAAANATAPWGSMV